MSKPRNEIVNVEMDAELIALIAAFAEEAGMEKEQFVAQVLESER